MVDAQGLRFKWLWVDFPCMPQGSRTPYQRTMFRWMLRSVNALYLGGSVLILMDSAYLSKFWTQFEAWLSMQRCTVQGLRPAANRSRWATQCIHSATSATELEQRWMNTTPQEAKALLSKPDCIVTNMSDKTTQLAKLATLDEEVQRSFGPETLARICGEAWQEDSFRLQAFVDLGFSKEQVTARVMELQEAEVGGDVGSRLLRAGYGREELAAEFGIFLGPDLTASSRLGCQRTLKGHGDWVFCLALNGTTLFSGSLDETIKVWDVQSGECRRTLTGHGGSVRCLALNGTTLFSGSRDKTIKVWDVQSGECRRTLTGHGDSVRCLALNGTTLCSGSYDKTIKVWDVQSGECRRTLTGHGDWVLCLALNGTTLCSGSWDKTIKVWDVQSGECRRTLTGHGGSVCCLALNGTTLCSGSWDKTIKVWDVQSGECRRTLTGHGDWVLCLALNGTTLFSGSADKTIKVWDVQSGECRRTLTGHGELGLLPRARHHDPVLR